MNIQNFAGVAQRRERLAHPGDAGSLPAPRSIHPFEPRTSIDTGPLWIAFGAACAGTAVLLVGIALRGLM